MAVAAPLRRLPPLPRPHQRTMSPSVAIHQPRSLPPDPLTSMSISTRLGTAPLSFRWLTRTRSRAPRTERAPFQRLVREVLRAIQSQYPCQWSHLRPRESPTMFLKRGRCPPRYGNRAPARQLTTQRPKRTRQFRLDPALSLGHVPVVRGHRESPTRSLPYLPRFSASALLGLRSSSNIHAPRRCRAAQSARINPRRCRTKAAK